MYIRSTQKLIIKARTMNSFMMIWRFAMRKLILCIFTLAAFMFSSVTAFASSGNVVKYEDDYVSIGANWESVEEGVIANSWINIQIGGSKGEGDILYYGTEYITEEGEYLGYRDFMAYIPEGTVIIENGKPESYHLFLPDISGQEYFWSPDMPEGEPQEPYEAVHSFEMDLQFTDEYDEMFITKSSYFDVKYRDFSKGVTYAAVSAGSVDGIGFEGTGNLSFSDYKGMAIGDSDVPEEPKSAAAADTGKPENNVLITKDTELSLYSGWEEYDPDTMEPTSYRELYLDVTEKGLINVGFFSIVMEGSLYYVRIFEGNIPSGSLDFPKKLDGSVTTDFLSTGSWYEFTWDSESGEEPVYPDPEEGELDVSLTWHLEEGREFRALSKYSSQTFSRMVHESVDTTSAWTEGTIDGMVLEGGTGGFSAGRFMTRVKGEYPWEK